MKTTTVKVSRDGGSIYLGTNLGYTKATPHLVQVHVNGTSYAVIAANQGNVWPQHQTTETCAAYEALKAALADRQSAALIMTVGPTQLGFGCSHPANTNAEARSARPPGQFTLPPRLSISRKVRVLGIDLTAGLEKVSAACILDGGPDGTVADAPRSLLRSDDDIVGLAMSEEWDCVAIDGPRGFPAEWHGFVDNASSPVRGATSRQAEREVHDRIGNIFWFTPRTFNGVREWLVRSIKLFELLKPLEERLIEVYPHATFMALVNGVTRRKPNPLRTKVRPGGRADRKAILASLLGELSLNSLAQGNARDHDIVDATAAAATALCHLAGRSLALGEVQDGGQIIVPNLPPQDHEVG
jgi:predicted nuclease with RNAse H fold